MSDPAAARSDQIGVLQRLARWRVPMGFVVGPLVIFLASPTPTSLIVGGIVAAAGEAVRIWAAGHLNKSREVTSSGPYRWVAHPLYVGSSIVGAGLAIASNHPGAVIAIALYLGVTIGIAIKAEEAFLRGKFGDESDRYRSRSAAADVPARRFSLERAVANREYRAVIGALVIVALLILKMWWRTA